MTFLGYQKLRLLVLSYWINLDSMRNPTFYQWRINIFCCWAKRSQQWQDIAVRKSQCCNFAIHSFSSVDLYLPEISCCPWYLPDRPFDRCRGYTSVVILGLESYWEARKKVVSSVNQSKNIAPALLYCQRGRPSSEVCLTLCYLRCCCTFLKACIIMRLDFCFFLLLYIFSAKFLMAFSRFYAMVLHWAAFDVLKLYQ